jgi:hypothetical protein
MRVKMGMLFRKFNLAKRGEVGTDRIFEWILYFAILAGMGYGIWRIIARFSG